MNNNFSLERIAKTEDLKADLMKRQYNLDKIAKFMENKSINPKLKQNEIAREVKIPSSTLQRYARETNMLSSYIIMPSSNAHTRKQKISKHKEHRFKMTSNEVKMTSKNSNENEKAVSKKVNTRKNSKKVAIQLVLTLVMEDTVLKKLFVIQ